MLFGDYIRFQLPGQDHYPRLCLDCRPGLQALTFLLLSYLEEEMVFTGIPVTFDDLAVPPAAPPSSSVIIPTVLKCGTEGFES